MDRRRALRARTSLTIVAALAVACGGERTMSTPPETSDAGTRDAGSEPDAGSATDGGAEMDAGETARDAGATDASSPGTCDGVTCSDEGQCYLDAEDVPRCACDACRFPTEDLRCVTSPALCTELGVVCNGSARCASYEEPCMCTPRGNPTVPACVCDAGYAYDGTDCVADIAACRPPYPCQAIIPTPGERKFQLEVSGAVNLSLIDYGSYDNWSSDGYLALFNDWYAGHCGSLSFFLPFRTLPAGVTTIPTSSVTFAVTYDQEAFRSDHPDAAGTVTVQNIDWCGTFDCTDVDLEMDVTLVSESGASVTVNGFVRGRF